MLNIFHVFGSRWYILRYHENLEKFCFQNDQGTSLGYSTTSQAYRVCNLQTKMVMKYINVKVDAT